MKENKHIDRIFQEKLKNLDATPNDAVWERINSELHQEDSGRKVIPIWWKFAGIAASLLLLIAIGYSVLNNDSEDANDIPTQVVDTNNTSNNTKDKNDIEKQDSQEKEPSDELLNNNLIPENQAVSNSEVNENDKKSGLNRSGINNSSNKTTINTDKKDAIVNSNQLNANNGRDKSNADAVYNKVLNTANNSIAGTKQKLEDKPSASNRKATANDATVASNEIPQNLPEQPTNQNNLSKDLKEAITKSSANEGVAATESSSEVIKEEERNNDITEEVKTSIEEDVAESEDGEDYDEKEKEVIDRWSVAANVSPVYYNSLGKGSSIHSEFNNNSKNGQLNMAYNVNASYAISKKLSVRSGVGRVNVGYNTNNIVVYNSLGTPEPQPIAVANGAVFRNIDLKEEAQGITIISGETLAFSQVPGAVAENLKSTLNQEISFIEVPVELEYKLSNKKLGVSLIGGFSTMILDGNEVYTQLNDERTLLGEANNINNISYSANFGVGFGVKISEKVNLNFEPSFKYQIKTFNNTSGDFKPYIIGVNSGLKFKF